MVLSHVSTMLPIQRTRFDEGLDNRLLAIHAPLVEQHLVAFLQEECLVQRKMRKAILGLSGGLDSAVTAYLCAKAFGPSNVLAIKLPYKVSSPESIAHADLVVQSLAIESRTIPITSAVDAYIQEAEPDISPARVGNLCARMRTMILFDQSAKWNGLPIGTGNKTERLFGYFTWHADDAPPINPLGDLYKTQVFALARHLGVPEVIIQKPPSADLIRGQTDEGDFGITYEKADQILVLILRGMNDSQIIPYGYTQEEISLVRNKVDTTHWKRKMPTVAMISDTAINEYFLRPVDYKPKR